MEVEVARAVPIEGTPKTPPKSNLILTSVKSLGRGNSARRTQVFIAPINHCDLNYFTGLSASFRKRLIANSEFVPQIRATNLRSKFAQRICATSSRNKLYGKHCTTALTRCSLKGCKVRHSSGSGVPMRWKVKAAIPKFWISTKESAANLSTEPISCPLRVPE